MTLWLRGGQVVDERGPYHADVVVSGARIEALGVVRPFGAFEELDCTGLWLIPGGEALDAYLERDPDVEGTVGGRLTPGQIVRVRSTGPAPRPGRDPREGRITPGGDADIVAVEPAAGQGTGEPEPRGDGRVRAVVRWVMRRGR